MATEQDWAAYADQAYLAEGDTILARTSGGAGVEVFGSHVLARRSDGLYSALGVVNSLVTGRAGYRLYNSGAVNEWFIGQVSSGDPHLRFQTLVAGVYTTRLTLENSGNLASGVDNSGNALGLPSLRWSVVYSATGTINTSDEREKEWRGALTEAELRAAKRIAGELGFYRWLDAVADKGDEARMHFGARAQQVWTIMADERLVDPITDGLPGATPYAFLCFDQWEATEVVTDDDGNVAVPARLSGNRFGLRVDQLALFLIAAQEQRIAALEAALP